MKRRLTALFLAAFLLLPAAGCATSPEPGTGTEESKGFLGGFFENFIQNDKEKPSGSDAPEEESSDGQELPADPIDLELQYDDRYTFPSGVKTIETRTVTSRQPGTDQADLKVVTVQSNWQTDTLLAVGTGTATVTLYDGTVYNVTVSPAPLSIFLIIGQDNAEGYTGTTEEVYKTARNQSIRCEEGKIYSTYAWSDSDQAFTVAGIQNLNTLSVSSASSFVAKTLRSGVTETNQPLSYPLNSLSKDGKGKTGIDSGLAWKWNELTGDKVWIVNCAATGSSIRQWTPGWIPAATDPVQTRCYENCIALMNEVAKTVSREILAGHYSLSRTFYFLLQGEADREMDELTYSTFLQQLHVGLTNDVKFDGQPFEAGGILSVRAYSQTGDWEDVTDNGPRLAQKAAVAAADGAFFNVFSACDVNDQWVEDGLVETYWAELYPESKYPFILQKGTYENPTTVAQVYTGTHYLQIGYNEMGIVAAQNAYHYYFG